MDEYTPTTEEIRSLYAWSYGDLGGTDSEDEASLDEFDRWLADHDKAVRRVALREAADAAMGPSVSGILHDGATARDIAGAIRALAEGDTNA